MDNKIGEIYKNRSVRTDQLLQYGFLRQDGQYVYQKALQESGFTMYVTVTNEGGVSAEIREAEWNDIYTLHLVEGAGGGFVGAIRAEYEQLLWDIAEHCFAPDVFRTESARELIGYVRETYGDELEFLWKKYSQNAVWRRKDTKKWYAVLLQVSKRKLGIASDEIVEVIDLRAQPEEVQRLIGQGPYYPGYHMNKKHWYTIILDGSVDVEEVKKRVQESYRLAVK